MIKKPTIALSLILLLILMLPLGSFANTIPSIDLEVTLHQDGSATFRDTRTIDVDSGTEHYIPFENLGESELLDFIVYENGQALEDVGTWDTDASREEKAGKFGVNPTSTGFELCFGIGDYAQKTFLIEYTLSNVVRNLENGEQALYWQMINPDMDPIDTIQVKVINDFSHPFTKDTTKIWGFGYEGTTSIEDTLITMNSGDSFSTSNYMVLLTIFENSPFSTQASYDYTSETLLDQAMEGASLDGKTYEDYLQSAEGGESFEDTKRITSRSPGSSGFMDRFFPFFRVIFALPIMIFVVSLVTGAKNSKKKKVKQGLYAVTDPERIVNDIPYHDGFHNTSTLIQADDTDVISAFMLKWVAEGRLVEEKELKGLIRKREALALRVNDDHIPETMSKIERNLWVMVRKAMGDDDLLSEKEFSKYVRKNISSFNAWTKELQKSSEDMMKRQGYTHEIPGKFLFFTWHTTSPNEQGRELINDVQGFKNYLTQYSLLNEREVTHVGIWDDYMIWAAYMGIADKVYEQLKISDPQFESYAPYDPTTLAGINYFSRSAISAQSSANSSSSSSSFGGGGGSSFSGGGGGASGGSSGGGTR